MPRPRPYGTGPYGVGPYERYRGTVYEVAGATQVAFQAHATVSRIWQVNAVSQITLGAQLNGLQRDCEIAGSTSIAWDVKVAGATRILNLHPLTEIILVVWSEFLETWTATGACGPSTWAGTPPCEMGVWQSNQICGTASWGSPGAAGKGVWQPVDPCEDGAWTNLKKAA